MISACWAAVLSTDRMYEYIHVYDVHVRDVHVYDAQEYGVHVHDVHVYDVQTYDVHVHDVHVHDVRAYDVHVHDAHVYDVRAYDVHVRDDHVHDLHVHGLHGYNADVNYVHTHVVQVYGVHAHDVHAHAVYVRDVHVHDIHVHDVHVNSSKAHKRLKQRFLIRRIRTKRANFREVLFSSEVQHKNRRKKQQQLIHLILCQLDAGRLANGKGHETHVSRRHKINWINCLFVFVGSLKKRTPPKMYTFCPDSSNEKALF